MAEGSFEGDAGADSLLPGSSSIGAPFYARVEIVVFDRVHWGEVREIEAFGIKLLQVTDAESNTTHYYGPSALFSLTMISQEELAQHMDAVRWFKELKHFPRAPMVVPALDEGRLAEQRAEFHRRYFGEPAPDGAAVRPSDDGSPA